MNIELYGERVNVRRFVLLVVAPLVCLAVAAFLFLPGSLLTQAVAAVLVLPVIVVCMDRPALIFYVLVFILFSNIDVYAPFRLYRVVLGLLLLSLAVAFVNGRRLVTHHPVLTAFFAAFAIVALQSLAVARDLPLARYTFSYVLKWMLAYFIVAQFTGNRRDFRRFLFIAAGGIALSDFLPLVVAPPAELASLSVMWNKGVVRYEGFVFEPNTFAMYQIYLIPILMFFIARYRRPIIARPLFAATLVASIVVLILSFSRGGFVALLCILALLLVLERRNKAILVSGLAMLAAAFAYSPGIYWERIQAMLNVGAQVQQDFSVFTRLETMKVAVRLGLEHPLFGIGISNFIYQSAYYVPYKLVVHNSFLQVFAELGIPGLALFVAIVLYNIIITVRLMTRRDDPEASLIGKVLFIQQSAIVVNSFFIPTAYEMIFWLTLGLPALADYAYRPEARETSEGEKVAPKLVA